MFGAGNRPSQEQSLETAAHFPKGDWTVRQFDLLSVLQKLGSQLNYSSHQGKNSTRPILSYLPRPRPNSSAPCLQPSVGQIFKDQFAEVASIGLPGVSTCPHLAPAPGKAKGSLANLTN